MRTALGREACETAVASIKDASSKQLDLHEYDSDEVASLSGSGSECSESSEVPSEPVVDAHHCEYDDMGIIIEGLTSGKAGLYDYDSDGVEVFSASGSESTEHCDDVFPLMADLSKSVTDDDAYLEADRRMPTQVVRAAGGVLE